MYKKVYIISLITLALCVGMIGITKAFIVRNTVANNIITFGNLKMQLLQTTINEFGNEEILDNNVSIDITNNEKLSRIIKIKNLGSQDFYARISLEIIGIDNDNNEFYINDFVKYNFNNDDWLYKEGWYYYKKSIKPEEITSSVINGIAFDINNITKKHSNCSFKLNIKTEAVQSKNNNEDVLNAVGWPSY